MSKLIAILNVIAWSGFWAFGYLALTTKPADSGQMTMAAVLAAAGAAVALAAALASIPGAAAEASPHQARAAAATTQVLPAPPFRSAPAAALAPWADSTSRSELAGSPPGRGAPAATAGARSRATMRVGQVQASMA